MNYLKNSNNFKSLFDFDKDEESYKEYEYYLDIYYSIPSKKDKYGREFIDGKMILYELKNPNKKIIINASKSVNLFYLNERLKLQSDIILETISTIIEKPSNLNQEDYDTFEKLKQKYSIYSQKIQEIDDIHKEYYEKMQDLTIKKINATLNMGKYYILRNSIFSKIEKPILKDSKRILIEFFHDQNNTIPSDTLVNKISKKLQIPSEETFQWFEWVEQCYKYLIAKKELYSLTDEMKKMSDTFNFKNEYFMIQKPTIEIIK